MGQVAVSNKETMEVVLVSVEAITRLLLRCAVYEKLYLASGLVVSVRRNIEDVLEKLYAAVFEFLAFATRYLEKSSTGWSMAYYEACYLR